MPATDDLPLRAELCRLMRARFGALTNWGGPLHAGRYATKGFEGPFYLDMLNRWLWSPTPSGRLSEGDAILSDEAVAQAVNPAELLRELLASAQGLFGQYLAHLKRYQDTPNFLGDLGAYLTDPGAVVVDAIALGKKPDSE